MKRKVEVDLLALTEKQLKPTDDAIMFTQKCKNYLSLHNCGIRMSFVGKAYSLSGALYYFAQMKYVEKNHPEQVDSIIKGR